MGREREERERIWEEKERKERVCVYVCEIEREYEKRTRGKKECV